MPGILLPGKPNNLLKVSSMKPMPTRRKTASLSSANILIAHSLAALMALVVSLILHIPGIAHPKAGQAAAPASNHAGIVDTAGNPSDIVIITKSGDKYHRPDCVYVQNKTNTQELTRKKAEALKKEPCAACRP